MSTVALSLAGLGVFAAAIAAGTWFTYRAALRIWPLPSENAAGQARSRLQAHRNVVFLVRFTFGVSVGCLVAAAAVLLALGVLALLS